MDKKRQASLGRPSNQPTQAAKQSQPTKITQPNLLPPTKITQPNLPPTLPALTGDQYVEIAKRAEVLYKQKNYPLAKYTFMIAIEGTASILKAEQDPVKKQELSQRLNNYLVLAEDCKRNVVQINQDLQKDPYVQQINQNMLEIKNNIQFNDIVGLQAVKQALQESVIFPNARPDIFQGIRAPPRGILLYGPPGNGKTMIARAVACESKVTFYNISASSLVSKMMGEGERLVKSLFLCAYQNQPSIIFVDEVDSILKARSENEHEASRRLKTEFLLQFDGANSSDQDRVIIIGATNRPEEIDSAALRRFTKRIYIDLPDLKTREQLIRLHSTDAIFNMNDKNYADVAKSLANYSCCDIKALVKEACMIPLRKLKKEELLVVDPKKIPPVSINDFQDAMKKVPCSITKKELDYFKNLQIQYNQQG